jgi:hypothetical protein
MHRERRNWRSKAAQTPGVGSPESFNNGIYVSDSAFGGDLLQLKDVKKPFDNTVAKSNNCAMQLFRRGNSGKQNSRAIPGKAPRD